MVGRIKNQKGFSAIEALLIIVIVGLIGGAGFYVYQAQKNTSKTLSAAAKDSGGSPKFVRKNTSVNPSKSTSSAANPYAGWKTYTLRFEKLTFKYPSQWKLTDNSNTPNQNPNTDVVSLASNDGFTFSLMDGMKPGGDTIPEDSANPVPVTFAGNSDYLVFAYARDSNGPGFSNTLLSGASLQTKPNDQYSVPTDKNVSSTSQVNNGGSSMFISASYGSSKSPFTSVAQAMKDPEYDNAKLVIESMRY